MTPAARMGGSGFSLMMSFILPEELSVQSSWATRLFSDLSFFQGSHIFVLRKKLCKLAIVIINGIRYHRYANASPCKECDFYDKCTPGKFRSIYRNQKEEFQERMRAKLKPEESQAKYNRWAHATESPYGHVKRNFKFIYAMRRGIERVRMEMAMLFMLRNILKAAPVFVEDGP